MSEPIAETRRTYDVIAAAYARQSASSYPQLLHEIASVTAELPAGALVADVGCGTGRDTGLLRANGLRVVGLDLSAGQLRAGGLPGVVRADMRRLPLRAASVDAVWCQAALLHLPRAEVPTVLGEFGRVVRTGGLLNLSVAEGDGERWEVASNYGASQRRWFTFHREPELMALLGAAGFVVREVWRTRTSREWLSMQLRRGPVDDPAGDGASAG